MSKVYSDVVKEVVSYKVKECTGIECDICGKVIDGEPRGYKDDDRVYYEVTTSHHDWGNDSIESIVHRDICPDCLIGFVDRYFKEARGSEEIEIERTYATRQDVRM